MRQASETASRLSPEEIVESAEQLLDKLDEDAVPRFVVDRLDKIRLMIKMISDVEWRLPHTETTRVLNALAYFAEPDDLIPDAIPGIGYLDDAIMIELVVRELKHEIEAYVDFCQFRRDVTANEAHAATSREAWLDQRRDELQSRMRRRRKRMLERLGNAARLRLFE